MLPPKILLLMLEFPTWETARPWSYPAHFAIEEGLKRNGVETVVVPVLAGIPSTSPKSWLRYVKQFYPPGSFDQVWVWLVHTELGDDIFEWISSIAPIRVGLIPESLTHTSGELERYPHLQKRRDIVFQQLKVFTHVLACDEKDVEDINAEGIIEAAWWTNMIPERFLMEGPSIPIFPQAVFYGSLYSRQRMSLVTHPGFQGVLANPQPIEVDTEWPNIFNALHEENGKNLEKRLVKTFEELSHYVGSLRHIRRETFRSWLKALEQWSAVVQLPTIVKCYSSRVVESMCVGRPCISWCVPNRPRNRALFQAEQEILFFDPADPDSLYAQIQKIQCNPEFGRCIGCNAQEKIRRFHTAEFRIQQYLEWIQTGKEPCYGEQSGDRNARVDRGTEEIRSHITPVNGDSNNAMGQWTSQSPELTTLHSSPDPTCARGNLGSADPSLRTTVYIVTVGDITFPVCQEAILKQERATFALEVIRNVHPMSAAFQEMISRCETEYFIQVDEDMILDPTAVSSMEKVMQKVPENVGMVCFHLFDVDRNAQIQGVKIYRTTAMKLMTFRDVKACEMDVLEQMAQKGIRWVLHPKVQGRHGTQYTPESIYRRYKTMYEKDIVEWNDVTDDIRKKAIQFRETGDPLALFALMGAVDGIVSVPYVEDQEKDFTKYNLKSLEVFRRVFLEEHPFPLPYEKESKIKPKCVNPPISLEQLNGKCLESQPPLGSMDGGENKSVIQKEPVSHSLGKGRRILLACQYFWPSVGGVETVVANLGREFVSQGYQVDVATVAMPDRTDFEHQGMRIISLDTTRKFESKPVPVLCWELHQLLTSGDYYACVLFANPHNWLITSLLLGESFPQTKIFIQLLVNREGFDEWRHDQLFCERLTKILKKADGALALTRQGIEAEFMKTNGISPIYLPNATTPIAPTMDFRGTYGIPRDAFLILHVANIWKVKNQLGLLHALSPIPPNWKVVLIGMPYDKDSPSEIDYGKQVVEALYQHPDILYIPGLPIECIAAAMKAADVLVLSSHAEISPMAIVEAMSYGIPWLATPDCGDVAEKAGGIVAPLELFPMILEVLQYHPDFRLSLGNLGFAHWSTCFSWEVIRQGWIETLETGSLSKTYEMPQEIAFQMNSLQLHFNTLLGACFSQMGATGAGKN
ncbi:MAG: glycosyltransferase, partial [Nitrospira sp.]|nr:glycosyltransferase [Nitrospira sp.]